MVFKKKEPEQEQEEVSVRDKMQVQDFMPGWAKELSLDKEQTSYNDLLDALRLSLKGYNIE